MEHIKKWNNFYEGYPLKIGAGHFLTDFQNLIENLHLKGFDPSAEPVPINSSGIICNGSHRVGACLALNIPMKVKVQSEISDGVRKIFAHEMEQSHLVSKETMDELVKSYVDVKTNTFGISFVKEDKLLADRISQFVDIVYFDDVKNLYVIESENQEMITRLMESLEDFEPRFFTHQEIRSILHL